MSLQHLPTPLDHPIVDPKFLSHSFDRKIIIDGLRQTLRLLQAPVYAKNTVEILGPDLDAEDELI
jgi:hypothetical protein